jgi:hypothetical protein
VVELALFSVHIDVDKSLNKFSGSIDGRQVMQVAMAGAGVGDGA